MPKGFPSRPTTNFAKEGLFNVLEHTYNIDDIDILDLCAGTGNLTFEFLSREYGRVTAIDSNYNCIRHIKSMGKQFGCKSELVAIKSDILKFLKQSVSSFDLIIADPPYAYEHYDQIVSIIFEKQMLNENGVLIIEHGKETNLSTLENYVKTKDYGNVFFSFFEIKE